MPWGGGGKTRATATNGEKKKGVGKKKGTAQQGNERSEAKERPTRKSRGGGEIQTCSERGETWEELSQWERVARVLGGGGVQKEL